MSRSLQPVALVCCLAAPFLFACERDESVQLSEVVITDSAGQYHVSLAKLEAVSAPQAELDEIYRTDQENSSIELFRVSGARFLEDGSLAVGNSGTNEILILDPEGSLVRRIGRAGEGPGEFRSIGRIDVDSSGALWVYDPVLLRLTRFGHDLTVSEVRRLASPTPYRSLRPLAVLADDRVLGIDWESGDFTVLGIRRDTTAVFVFRETGEVGDTLRLFPAREWNFAALTEDGQWRGTMKNELGFGRSLGHAGRNGYAALGSTDSLDVIVYGRDGQVVMRVRGGGGGDAVGAGELEQWRKDLADRASGAPLGYLKSAILETPHRETYPAFGSVLLDDRQRLWLGVYPRPGETEQKNVVVGPDGKLWGIVVVPAGGEVLDVAHDRVAIARSTDLDEEVIEVLRVAWPT